MDAGLLFESSFPRPDVSCASGLAFCLGDSTELDHEGFEDAVRPTESDPIQLCFVSRGNHVPMSGKTPEL